MNEYLLESYFDDNTNNTYYTDAVRTLRLILGGAKETGTDSFAGQVYSSYAQLPGSVKDYLDRYANEPKIMDGFRNSGYYKLKSSEEYNAYAKKYIYLVARCIPSVAKQFYNYSAKFLINTRSNTKDLEEFVKVSERDAKKIRFMANQAASSIISSIQNGISTRSNLTVDDDGHATNTFSSLLEVLNKKFIVPSNKVVDTVVSYFNAKCTEQDLFAAQWVLTLLLMNTSIEENLHNDNDNVGKKKVTLSDGTVKEYDRFSLSPNESVPRQILDTIQYKARDDKRSSSFSNSDNLLFKNIDQCSQKTTDPRKLITNKTKFTPRYEIPLFNIEYGSRLDHDINVAEKSKSAKDVLYLATLLFRHLDPGAFRNDGSSHFIKGATIDSYLANHVVSNTDLAIRFRSDALFALNDITDEIISNVNKDSKSEEDAEKQYWVSCANSIKKNWFQANNVQHPLSSTFANTSLNPCIGSDDDTAKTMLKNRSGLSTNGANMTKHMVVDSSDFTLHVLGGYEASQADGSVSDVEDVINLNDDLRPSRLSEYIAPFLVKDGSVMAAIYGIVPYTAIDNGTALDSVESSDVNAAVNNAVYNGMRPSIGEKISDRVDTRLNDPTFVDSVARAGFISQDEIENKDNLVTIADSVTNAFVNSGYDKNTVFSQVTRVFNEFTYAANIMAREAFKINNSADERKEIRKIVYNDAPTVKQMFSSNADKIITDAVDQDIYRIVSRYYNTDTLMSNYREYTDIDSMVNYAKLFKKFYDTGKSEKALFNADKMAGLYKIYAYRIRKNNNAEQNNILLAYTNSKIESERLSAASRIYDAILPNGELNQEIEDYRNSKKLTADDFVKKAINGELKSNGSSDDSVKIVQKIVSLRDDVIAAYQDAHEDCVHVGKDFILSVISAMHDAAKAGNKEDLYTLESNFAKMHASIVTFASLVKTSIPKDDSFDESDYKDSIDTDLTVDKINKADSVGISPNDIEVKNTLDEIKQTGTVDVDDEDVQQFNELSDSVDQLIFIATRTRELNDEIEEANDLKELISVNRPEGTSSASSRMAQQYYDTIDQINEKIERFDAVKTTYLTDHPEMRGILNTLISNKISASEIKLALDNIASSAEILSTLIPNEYTRAEYTSSDATTLAQIVYVLGIAVIGNVDDDVVAAIESMRDVIANDSGNPVSMSVIDKVVSTIKSADLSDITDITSKLVKLINLAGGVFKKESKTINDYVGNFKKFTTPRSEDLTQDNGIDAFARARLRQESSNANKSKSNKEDQAARQAYIGNIVSAMKKDPEIAEFAYAVGIACGTFNRNIDDERYDEQTRYGRMMQSITDNVTGGNLLYGNLADNPVQLEVLSAIIDDERANDHNYSRLGNLVNALQGGKNVLAYTKNYDSSFNELNSGNSKQQRFIAFNSEGKVVGKDQGSPIDIEDIIKMASPGYQPTSMREFAKAARDVLIPKFERAIKASPESDSEGAKIAMNKITELLNDLDTPLSYIIAATTSVGQKAGAQAMMKHNDDRLRDYANGKTDDNLADDLSRIAIEQNGVIPQRLSEELADVDLQWIHSVADVLSNIPVSDIDAGMALNYVSMYYGSDEERRRMLLDKNGKIMYKIIYNLEALDTESGLPHGFFGNDTSKRYKNMSSLISEFYSFSSDNENADDMADDLEEAFIDAQENGDTSMRIGKAIPSEVTRKKIAHMRLSHGISNVIDYAAYGDIVEELKARNYIVDSPNTHIVKLASGVVFDDNTFKTIVERALTKVIKWNFMNDAENAKSIKSISDDAVKNWCNMSETDGDVNSDFVKFVNTLNYEIAASKSGINMAKLSKFSNIETVNVSNDICKKLYAFLSENGMFTETKSAALVHVKGVGYIPSLVIIDTIKCSASVLMQKGIDLSGDLTDDAKKAFITEFNNELNSLKNNSKVYDLPKVDLPTNDSDSSYTLSHSEDVGSADDTDDGFDGIEVHPANEDDAEPAPTVIQAQSDTKPAAKKQRKPRVSKPVDSKPTGTSGLESIDVSDLD